jgi:membrane fusion protein (multidrug efflux system)
MLNPKTRLVDADVATATPLLPGESFRVDILVGQKQGWLVPRNAVLSDDKGAYLFQTKNGKAARIDVTIVATLGDRSAVTGPIDARSPIVTEGNYELSDGAAVRDASGS